MGRISGRIIQIHSQGIEVLCGSGSVLITEIEDKEDNMVINLAHIFKSIAITLQ